jgi:hypothetical protein
MLISLKTYILPEEERLASHRLGSQIQRKGAHQPPHPSSTIRQVFADALAAPG